MTFPALVSIRRFLTGCVLIGSAVGLITTSTRAQDNPPPPLPEPAPAEAAAPAAADLKAVIAPASTRFAPDAFVDLTSFAKDLPPALPDAPRDRAERYVRTARDHRAAGRWQAALDATGHAIAADPGVMEGFQLRAEVYSDKHLFAHAIAALDAGLVFHWEDPTLLGYRGLLQAHQQQAEAGLIDIRRAIDRAAGDAETLHWLGDCQASALGKLGDLRGCVARFDRPASAVHSNPEILEERGAALLALREFDRALADFEEAATLQPGPRALCWRGWARLRAGRFAEAVVDLDQARLAFPTSVPTQCYYGLALFAAGRRAEAIALLDSLLKQADENGDLQTVRGWVALLSGDFTLAHDLLSQAADQGVGRVRVDGFVSSSFFTDPHYDAILADFEARCRVHPTLPFAVYYRQGDAARTAAMPRPRFIAALVCRFPRSPEVAPMGIVRVFSEYLDQPWRPAAHLGEFLAAACLLDPAKLRAAGTHFADWASEQPLP